MSPVPLINALVVIVCGLVFVTVGLLLVVVSQREELTNPHTDDHDLDPVDLAAENNRLAGELHDLRRSHEDLAKQAAADRDLIETFINHSTQDDLQ